MIRWLQIWLGVALISFSVHAQTVRWGSSEMLNFVDPIPDASMASLMVGNLIYDPLLRFGDKGQIEPRIVSHWQQLTPWRWQLTLRSDITFSSGNKLTAEDLLWSLHALRQHRFYSEIFSIIDSVKILSPYKINVQLKQPSADFLYRLTYWFVYDHKWLLAKQHRKHLLVSGSGPFQLTENVPGIRAVLTRKRGSDSVWSSQNDVSRLIVIPMHHEKTRFRALANGDVDMVDRLSADRLPMLDKLPKLQAKTARYMNWTGLIFNEKHAPLNDPRVRQALSLAIDGRMLSEHVVQQLGILATQLSPPDANGYNVEVSANYSPELAYQLMQSSGVGEPRKPLQLVVMADPHLDMHRCAWFLRLMLMRINVEVKINVLPRDEFEKALSGCHGDLFLMSLKGRPNDTMMRIKYFLNGIKGHDAPPLNCSPQRSQLFQQWLAIEQQANTEEAADELQQFVADLDGAHHFKPLFWQYGLWGVTRQVSAKAIDNSLGFPYFDKLILNHQQTSGAVAR